MRFLIAPNFALAYDQRMVRSLALELHHLGHEAKALSAPIDDFALADVCRAYDPDVVIRVNRFRPRDNPLPPKVRHIAWFQDIFPETLGHVHDRIQNKDIVYVLGDPQTLGFNVQLPCYVGTLLCGIDETIKPAESAGREIDFSLCGFIPRPLRLTRRISRELIWVLASPVIVALGRVGFVPPELVTRVRSRALYPALTGLVGVVEATYQPLRGNLDIHQLTTAMNEFLAANFEYKPQVLGGEIRKPGSRQGFFATAADLCSGDPADRWGAAQRLMSLLARDYPRLLDRVSLISEVLEVSNSLELYGLGWSAHPAFRQYHKGILDSAEDLASVFCRSRINLANNTHGLGLHSRTLECIAVGGFIFTHASPADGKPGGMHTAFEPGAHYGMFTPETFGEEARRWLRDEAKRKQAGAEAAVIVRQNHTWRHRAEQILADLRHY